MLSEPVAAGFAGRLDPLACAAHATLDPAAAECSGRGHVPDVRAVVVERAHDLRLRSGGSPPDGLQVAPLFCPKSLRSAVRP